MISGQKPVSKPSLEPDNTASDRHCEARSAEAIQGRGVSRWIASLRSQ